MERLGSSRVKIIKEQLYDERYPLSVLEVTTAKTEGLAQTILIDDGFYVLGVECPEITEQVRMDAKRFFDSFKIIAEPNQASDAQ
jgi:hypothetical protein